jgi:CheY-like chemotaxis protein
LSCIPPAFFIILILMSKEPIARILIIEDDPDGRRSVAEAMQEAGYAVVTAATGEIGIRLFQEQTFDAGS